MLFYFTLVAVLTGPITCRNFSGPITCKNNSEPINYRSKFGPITCRYNSEPINVRSKTGPITYKSNNSGPITYRNNSESITCRHNSEPIIYRNNSGPITYKNNNWPITYRNNSEPITHRRNSGPTNCKNNSGPIGYRNFSRPKTCFDNVSKTSSNESLSLPSDLDLDEDTYAAEDTHQIVLYGVNKSRDLQPKQDHDYYLKPPYFPLVLRPKSEDYLFSTKFFTKRIFVTKEGHLLADSKDIIMTHFQRQLELCHKMYTSRRHYFLSKSLNKHHEFTQLANILWDRYKEIEISFNKLFLALPLNLKYKLKLFHVDEKRISLNDWWNIESTLDAEFTALFNQIRYDLYKAYDMFDCELHLKYYHPDDKGVTIPTTTSSPLVRTIIRKMSFNDSLVEEESEEIPVL
uniref:Uncharacterized protein n=1 Tax=Cacopsylla melanoneura TaxID=428564 RepID=A0A8D8WFS7_9HEMI